MGDQLDPQSDPFEAKITLRLSRREKEIVQMLASGLRGKEIAVKLGLSAKTVDTYRTRAMLKMRVTTSAQLVKYWIEQQPRALEPTEAVEPSALFASPEIDDSLPIANSADPSPL